jgi:hypothetical protein
VYGTRPPGQENTLASAYYVYCRHVGAHELSGDGASSPSPRAGQLRGLAHQHAGGCCTNERRGSTITLVNKTLCAALTVMAVVLVGCHAKVESGGMEVYDVIWERTDLDLRYRSAMDLGCHPAQVQLSLVQKQGKFPTSVHAMGCGSQALYSRQLRRSKGHYTDRNSTWVRESQGVLPPGPMPALKPVLVSTRSPGEGPCVPLRPLPAGCSYTHYRGFMQYDHNRMYVACEGDEPVDVTAKLPSQACELPER